MLDMVLLKTVSVALGFALLFWGEARWPATPWPTHARKAGRWLKNGGLWLLNSAASPIFVVPLTAAAATLVPGWRPTWWAGPLPVLLDVLLLDALIYGWHRLNHEWPFLWRFHAVHHLDRILDTTSAVRFHLGEVLLSAVARGAMVALLDIPLQTVLLFEVLVLISALFHHSNVHLPTRLETLLGWVIVTPAHHWVHHHARRIDTDSNYSTIFSVWDRLFASRSATIRAPGMPIGIEGESHDPSLGRLLLYPFRHRNDAGS